jgi:hypothetical protein
MTTTFVPQPRKAEKRRVKLKMGVQGPSGSGKTWGALSLAKNLWPTAKICVVDTENDSASLYADRFEFDTIPLPPPFETARYEACIEAVVRGGYDVLIMDSISHQWDGEGGILRRKEEKDQRGGNSYANWSSFTPEHTHFVELIKQAPIHIIATMRSKQDYILEDNGKGKQAPRKVGMAPVQRDGFDYEFSIVFDVQMDHKAAVSKNRTGLFEGKILNLADKKVADQLREWLESGKEVQDEEKAGWKLDNKQPDEATKPAESAPAKPAEATSLITGKVDKPKQTDKGIWFELNGKQVYAPHDISITSIHVGDECELEVVPSKTKKGTEYFRLVRISAVVKEEPPQDEIDKAAADLFQEKTA